jgi:hypothetical protein
MNMLLLRILNSLLKLNMLMTSRYENIALVTIIWLIRGQMWRVDTFIILVLFIKQGVIHSYDKA